MPRAAATPKTKADKEAALSVIRCEVASCTLCPQLASTRTQTVFGVGNPLTKVCFFGEAPGADEDAQGEPFVGRAGQLLNKIIEACGWKREEIYILNVLKCRPPGNRRPEEDEVTNCRGYYERQLEIIRPDYIVCLGATAAQALLSTTESIGKLRGKFHPYEKTKVVATYHPAYLLRNPEAKKDVWEDMKMLMRDMGREV
jgi:DNA polymerase